MKVTLNQKRLGVIIDKSTGLTVNLKTDQVTTGNLAFVKSIRDSDLTVANLIVLNHNFNYHPRNCVIYDSNGEVINPDNQGNLTVNVYFIDLTSYRPLLGNYEVILDG